MISALALLLAVQATAQSDNPVAGMPPAEGAAIRAGGKACVGATVDPTGLDARLAEWSDATPAGKSAAGTNGRMVKRDNVLLMVKPGIDGGCVVMANVDRSFDKAAFYGDLGTDLGVKIATDPKNPVTELGNGEVLVTVVAQEGGTDRVVLVVGNPNSKNVKNKGN